MASGDLLFDGLHDEIAATLARWWHLLQNWHWNFHPDKRRSRHGKDNTINHLASQNCLIDYNDGVRETLDFSTASGTLWDMSMVTDVLLNFHLEERFDENYNLLDTCEALDKINAWLEEEDLGKLDELSWHVVSSGKAMQCYVYGGAFNFLELDRFVSLVQTQEWKCPESVILLTKAEEDEVFAIHKMTQPHRILWNPPSANLIVSSLKIEN